MPFAVKIAVLGDMGATPLESSVHVASCPAVGAAIAAGEAALATFLVVGFTIHNVSEGFGIAAPLVGRRPRLLTFIGLAALAGLPAVPGVWIGERSGRAEPA